jgi:hypothetical protein
MKKPTQKSDDELLAILSELERQSQQMIKDHLGLKALEVQKGKRGLWVFHPETSQALFFLLKDIAKAIPGDRVGQKMAAKAVRKSNPATDVVMLYYPSIEPLAVKVTTHTFEL